MVRRLKQKWRDGLVHKGHSWTFAFLCSLVGHDAALLLPTIKNGAAECCYFKAAVLGKTKHSKWERCLRQSGDFVPGKHLGPFAGTGGEKVVRTFSRALADSEHVFPPFPQLASSQNTACFRRRMSKTISVWRRGMIKEVFKPFSTVPFAALERKDCITIWVQRATFPWKSTEPPSPRLMLPSVPGTWRTQGDKLN